MEQQQAMNASSSSSSNNHSLTIHHSEDTTTTTSAWRRRRRRRRDFVDDDDIRTRQQQQRRQRGRLLIILNKRDWNPLLLSYYFCVLLAATVLLGLQLSSTIVPNKTSTTHYHPLLIPPPLLIMSSSSSKLVSFFFSQSSSWWSARSFLFCNAYQIPYVLLHRRRHYHHHYYYCQKQPLDMMMKNENKKGEQQTEEEVPRTRRQFTNGRIISSSSSSSPWFSSRATNTPLEQQQEQQHRPSPLLPSGGGSGGGLLAMRSSSSSSTTYLNNNNNDSVHPRRRLSSRFPNGSAVLPSVGWRQQQQQSQLHFHHHVSRRRRRQQGDPLTQLYMAQDDDDVTNNNNDHDGHVKKKKKKMNDQQEWKAIVMALTIYKAAYGNVQVPQRFVVPNLKPWPKEAWGMRLGIVVQNIRTTGKYIGGNGRDGSVTAVSPRRRAWLDEIGFVWGSTGSSAGSVPGRVTQPKAKKKKIGSTTKKSIVKMTKSLVTSKKKKIKAVATTATTVVAAAAAASPQPLLQDDNEMKKEKLDSLSLLSTTSSDAGAVVAATRPPLSQQQEQVRPPTTTMSTPTSSITDTTTTTAMKDDKEDEEDGFLISDNDDEETTTTTTNERELERRMAAASDNPKSANDLRFERVYRALNLYKQIYGDLLVPQPFVVPQQNDNEEDQEGEWWSKIKNKENNSDLCGLRLGARVNAIRSQGTFVNKNPERKQLLDDLGFVWNPPRSSTTTSTTSATDLRQSGKQQQQLGTAADAATDDMTFGSKDGGGELDGDAAFGLNDDDDDELSSLFDKAFDLKSFGMDRDNNNNNDDDAMNQGKPTTTTTTTTATWGFQGGGDLQELARLQQKQLEQRMAKDEGEYIPPRTLAESLEEARIRAQDVGIIESTSGRIRKGKREKDIPWFNDDFGNDFVFDDVLEALTIYKSLYGDFGNLTLNHDFVIVPSPPALMSLRSGFLRDNDYDDMHDDDDDDFMIMPSSSSSFDADASARAAQAIARFEEQGDFDQSQDLIAAEIQRLQQDVAPEVTAEVQDAEADTTTTATMTQLNPFNENNKVGEEWPEHLAGMELGRIVSRIQDGSLEVRHLEERKAKLDAIGFDWGDDKYFIDVPFEKAMCAMYAYYLVRGDMFVYEDFVMPNEDPWPQALAGYEIGKAVKRIRELQNFMEAYHPEKVSLLRMIDFVWFPTVALPLDPNDEFELDNEMLRLTGLGHPDYAIRDIPLGIHERILEDGPFVDTGDDPKLWWREWHNWDYVKDYWYEQGRRDNSYVLRKMGYPKMADEHEAKYGPGLFEQLEWTLAPLRDDEESVTTKSEEERKDLLKKLNYFRLELTNCTDIHRDYLDELLEELDVSIEEIMRLSSMRWDDLDDDDYDDNDTTTTTTRRKDNKKKKEEITLEGSNTADEAAAENDDTDDANDDMNMKIPEEDNDLLIVEEDFDVDGELGLQPIR